MMIILVENRIDMDQGMDRLQQGDDQDAVERELDPIVLIPQLDDGVDSFMGLDHILPLFDHRDDGFMDRLFRRVFIGQDVGFDQGHHTHDLTENRFFLRIGNTRRDENVLPWNQPLMDQTQGDLGGLVIRREFPLEVNHDLADAQPSAFLVEQAMGGFLRLMLDRHIL